MMTDPTIYRLQDRAHRAAPMFACLAVLFALAAWLAAASASAQEPSAQQPAEQEPSAQEPGAPASGWNSDVEVKKSAPPAEPAAAPAALPGKPNMTVIERSGSDAKADGASAGAPQLKLVALLTADGQQIDRGLVWRVFQSAPDAAGKSKMITENRDASPSLKLQPGEYTINASFGRANLTRKVSVKPNTPGTEKFVLNAGGLRLNANVAGKPAAPGMVSYAIFSDDRDQFANRTAVMTGAKPSLIIRLNAGIYRIVSTYGDANARVETDVTVEAGKLTEAAVAHAAGKANFKLVNRTGGEALPDTHWTILSAEGETIKESVGALPTHALSPGTYSVAAKSGGRMFKRAFVVKDGQTTDVEVMSDQPVTSPTDAATTPGTQSTEPEAIAPSLEIKSP